MPPICTQPLFPDKQSLWILNLTFSILTAGLLVITHHLSLCPCPCLCSCWSRLSAETRPGASCPWTWNPSFVKSGVRLEWAPASVWVEAWRRPQAEGMAGAASWQQVKGGAPWNFAWNMRIPIWVSVKWRTLSCEWRALLLGSGWGRGSLGGWVGGWGRRAVASQASRRGGRTLPSGRLVLLVPLEFVKATTDYYWSRTAPSHMVLGVNVNRARSKTTQPK